MNVKKIFLSKIGSMTLSVAVFIGGFLPVVGHAAEPVRTNEIINGEVGIAARDESTVTLSDSLARATVTITGKLSGSKPLLLKPRATATTSTTKNVSQIRAKVDSNNNGNSTSTSGWKTLSSTSYVSSGQLIATTSKARFTGYHQAKLTSSASWVSTKNTTISF